MIAIRPISTEKIEPVLAGIVKDIVVVPLVGKGIFADGVPLQRAIIQIERGDGGLTFRDVEKLIYITFVLAAVDDAFAENEIYGQLIGIGPGACPLEHGVEGDEGIPCEDEKTLVKGVKVETCHLRRGFRVYALPEKRAVDQPDGVVHKAGEVAFAIVYAIAVPFVEGKKMMFIVVAHLEIADGHIRNFGVVLVLAEDQVGRHPASEAEAVGAIHHTVDPDGDVVLVEIQVNLYFQPPVLLQQGCRDGNGELIASGIDIEIEAAGAIGIQVAEAIGQVFVGQVEDIAKIGIVPEGEVEGKVKVAVKNGDPRVKDTVRSALGKQAILRFELKTLGAGMQGIQA